jgi:hypothetical protein
MRRRTTASRFDIRELSRLQQPHTEALFQRDLAHKVVLRAFY